MTKPFQNRQRNLNFNAVFIRMLLFKIPSYCLEDQTMYYKLFIKAMKIFTPLYRYILRLKVFDASTKLEN